MNIVKLGMAGIAAVSLVGCATTDVDYSGLASSVQKVEGDDFGQCIAESHRASMRLDEAKVYLKSLQDGSNSEGDLDLGQRHISAAAAHKAKAMKGCDAALLPIRKRLAAVEAQVRDHEARLKKLETVREIIRGVTFPTGSARLTKQAQTVLNVVANRLQREPRMVEISGHSSSTGKPAMNMKLSQARAESVKKFLVSEGVDGSKISARGYGSSQPVASNDTASGRRANQRIELKFN